jgi:hypothetical protein
VRNRKVENLFLTNKTNEKEKKIFIQTESNGIKCCVK